MPARFVLLAWWHSSPLYACRAGALFEYCSFSLL